MNFLMIILLLGFASCGKPANESNKINSINSARADLDIHQDDINKIVSVDQKSIVTIAYEIQKISTNYVDYPQFLKALDRALSIRCHQVCTIRRKK